MLYKLRVTILTSLAIKGKNWAQFLGNGELGKIEVWGTCYIILQGKKQSKLKENLYIILRYKVTSNPPPTPPTVVWGETK